MSRDFVRPEVPDEEVKGKQVFLACVKVTVMSVSTKLVIGLPDLWLAIQRVSQYSNNFDKVVRILARLVRIWKLRKDDEIPTKENVGDPTANNIETAEKLLLLSAMPDTASALNDLRLVSLCPKKAGSLIVSCGRLGERSLSRLLGVPHLRRSGL